MGDYRPVKYFPMGFFKDADEPVICGDFIVFVQNIYNGTRIVIYNIVSGKMETVVMENKLCFNLHSENNCIAFEFAGIRHGIGVIFLDTLETFEYTNAEQDILFGGIWNKCLIYRDAHNIFLLHMENKSKDALAYCHNVLGPPAVGYGTCAWLQLYKEKSCIIFYDILKNKILVLSSPGFINRICAVGRYIVYQSCFNNKCVIYKYDIGNGRLESIFEKSGWIELYEGKDDKIIFTVRKQFGEEYLFDLWIYNLKDDEASKILSDYRNLVIPAVSDKVLLLIAAKEKGDDVSFMEYGP